ncbi:hypothetical protein [Actinomadura sp. WAC 06369]|uniref:hypothetical protein n=1 Tax=Actinomadura sp. WAC 06369 TaxID=2203193 RepID=UPI000F778F6A|nr:hypothetical protein [Actinomadura sp. WAC 06369]RSN55552.1 hypothetical protein DMH08_25990 [Actinomadura sp. WAC 06369]
MPNPHWQTFLVAAPLMALTPGANQVLSLRNALQQGPANAIAALMAYAGVGGALTSRSLTARVRRLLDRATGCTMLAVAAWPASTRP